MAQRPNLTQKLAAAVELALSGDWQGAHEIAQQYEDDRDACWLHAVVHRIEGDLSNARYWYGRCRRSLREHVSTDDELREIALALAERKGPEAPATR